MMTAANFRVRFVRMVALGGRTRRSADGRGNRCALTPPRTNGQDKSRIAEVLQVPTIRAQDSFLGTKRQEAPRRISPRCPRKDAP